MRWRTEAVVLGAELSGESDRRVHLLTPDSGRLWASAKGAQKSMKRFAGLFDLAQVLDLGLLTTGRSGRIIIEHADLVEAHPVFRQGAERLARASALLELGVLLTPEQSHAPGVYPLVRRGLARLATDPDQDRWLIAYGFRMLAVSGYRPELRACVRCLKKAARHPWLFLPGEGGLICSECGAGMQGLTVSPGTARTIEALVAAREPALSRLTHSRKVAEQARVILEQLIGSQLPNPLRSLAVLRELQDGKKPAPV